MGQFILDQCNRFLEHYFSDDIKYNGFRILEAGGGSFSHFSTPDNSVIACLDISMGQLIRNEKIRDRIRGDIQSLPIGSNSLEMIICFNVLEHLEDPESALSEMYRVLSTNGIMLIGCPNRRSLKSLITRLTPIWFHRLYYRFVVGKVDRGEGHCDAFPTPFGSIVSTRGLGKWLRENQMEILFKQYYDGVAAYKIIGQTRWSQLFSLPYYGLAFLLQILTLNYWKPLQSDILLVAKKVG